MKRLSSRWLSLLLVLSLVFSLLTPALAADDAETVSDLPDEAVVLVEEEASEAAAEAPEGPEAAPVGPPSPQPRTVTSKDLPDYAVLPEGVSVSSPLTIQEVIYCLIKGSGLEDKQLGSYPDDFNAFALSLGMIDEFDKLDDLCTKKKLTDMRKPADQLHAAVNPKDGKLVPAFINGRAQPIFPYTTGAVDAYDNAESDIIRYCVYVETDYDTDGDGKLDLVKALVQVPRSAAEGNYKAATIYEARPYITGTTNLSSRTYTAGDRNEFDYDDLYAQPAARVPAGAAVGTLDAAANAVSSDWYYVNPQDRSIEFEDLTWYDYYLVRGFAVVESGGIGTMGSEGFETCGTDLEIASFRCVIEWLTGDRVAYTDKTNNIPVEADWSAGSVGTTGRSYAGTTQFGLATTGVKGLKTIVPVAGIASWYEYTNSQGISTRSNAAYEDYLAAYCAGRYLDPEDFATIADRYYDYLNQLYVDQRATPGDYFEEVWGVRDYTLNAKNIKIPALIVHGLNDYNVRTKETDLMYRAFKEAGFGDQVKLIFHQDGHLTPTYPAGGLEFLVNGQLYDEILNQWFSHYLCGVKNDVEDMPVVQAQSNQNPDVWGEFDSWEPADTLEINADMADDVAITSNYASFGVTNSNWQATFSQDSTPGSVAFVADVEENTVIKGSIAVKFTATVDNEQAATETPNGDVPSGDVASIATPNGDALDPDNFVNPLTFGIEDDYADYDALPVKGIAKPLDGDGVAARNSLMVSAMLVDLNDTSFDTVNTSGNYVTKEVLKEAGAWQGGGLDNWDFVRLTPTSVKYKIIARGWMDLCNPGAGYDSKSADTRVALDPNVPNDYTIYLQPNVYSIPAGHKLAVVIYAYEPGFTSYSEQYVITLKKGSVSAELPVEYGDASAATLKEDSYNLAVSATRNAGSVTIKNETGDTVSAGLFPHDTKLTLTANVNAGYQFTKWTVNGVDVGTDPTLELTLDSDKSVSATYAQIPTVTLTVEAANGNVALSRADGGNVFVRNNLVYKGTEVIFTATANEGYVFAGWTVDGKDAGTTNPLTLTIDANTLVTAAFEPILAKRQLTITESQNGAIVPSVEGRDEVFVEEGKVFSGDVVSFTAKPNSGYRFTGWVINGQPGGTANPLALTIDEDTEIGANFARKSTGGGGSSSGSGSSTTTSPVTIDKVDNATVTADAANAKAGDTVTITVKPTDGYKVEKVTVTDKNGDAVKVTDNGDGTYSFKMPATGVTVTPVIGKVEGSEPTTGLKFVDVPEDAYFFTPVYWAVDKGITNGTDDTHFSPDDACTRAQMLTFLWRSAGKPAPSSTTNPFTDVAEGAYYYDAVLWAVEKGITTGVTPTTFDPDGKVDRAQSVTFLYRYLGEKTEATNPFTDVAEDAYYFDAVLWAAAKNVTTGKTATTFDPTGDCTRAQIVTFLYRAAQ